MPISPADIKAALWIVTGDERIELHGGLANDPDIVGEVAVMVMGLSYAVECRRDKKTTDTCDDWVVSIQGIQVWVLRAAGFNIVEPKPTPRKDGPHDSRNRQDRGPWIM